MASSFSNGDGRPNIGVLVRQPAVMIGIGIVLLLLVLAFLRSKTRATSTAAQSGVVANPGQGPTQASDVGATAALGGIQHSISTFEQDLSTWIAQHPHVPTTDNPAPVSQPSPWQHGTVPTPPPGWNVVARLFNKDSGVTYDTEVIGTNAAPYNPTGPAYWKTPSPQANDWTWSLQPIPAGA
jgi:hypothetical protein